MTDGSGVQAVTATIAAGLTVAATDQGSNRWTADLPTPVEESDRVMTVVATDALGNVTTATRLVKVDRIPPTLSVTAPAMNSVQTSGAVTLAVTTSADTGQVIASLGGNMVTLTGGPSSWTGAPLPLPVLDGVSSFIRVAAQDLAGNTAFVDHPIVIDSVAPTVVITAPLAGTFHRSLIAIGATTTGSTATLTATLEGVTVPFTGGPTVWNAAMPPVQHDFAPATLRVTATDASGNSSSTDLAISVDTVAPVVVMTAPSAGRKFNASDLSSNPGVMNSWSISDGDPQAATTTVNGAAATGLSLARLTNASDDPTSYTNNVLAADRAGNIGSASVTYSADRVAPTITAWTPAAGARMVEPRQSQITFSEPVFGATTQTPALEILSQTTPANDVWDLNHSRYLVPLDAFRGQVLDVRLTAGLADSSGNPVATPAVRKFHLATTIPSGTLLASNVGTFSAASDADGVLKVAYLTTTGVHRVVVDALNGSLSDFAPVTAASGTRVTINTWSTVNPVSLTSASGFGVSIFNAAAPSGSRYRHYALSAGVFINQAATAGAVITVPPLNREAATDPAGFVIGSTYTRGSFTQTLPTAADMLTAQSADSWVVANYSGNQVRWSRYRCNRDTQLFPGPPTYTCEGTEYGGTLGTLTLDFAEAVMTRSGRCLVVSARQRSTDQGGDFYQPLVNCDGALGVSPPPSCYPNTALTSSTGYIRQKMALFSANGEDTILFAFPAGTGNPSEFRLEKMAPGVCAFSTSLNTLFSVPNVRDFQPAQIGNKPAFIYVNTSNELRVFIP